MQVRRYHIDTAELVTLDDANSAWQGTDIADLEGKFVRLKPAAETTDSSIRAMKKAVLDAGALAARVMPKPPSDKLQLSAGAQLVEQIAAGSDTIPSVRELMAQLVAASTSRYKSDLETLLGRLADEEGL